MNRLFTAWVETVYHARAHSETGQPPLARWEAGAPFAVPAPADLAEAFRWAEWRTVSKTALVSLHDNRYQVDPALAGRRVELVFDPLWRSFHNGSYGDLGIIAIRCLSALPRQQPSRQIVTITPGISHSVVI